MVPELVSLLCTGFLVGYLVLHVFFRVRPTIKGVTALLGTAFGGAAFLLFKDSSYLWFYPMSLFAGGLIAAGVYYIGRRQLRQKGTIKLHYIGDYEVNYEQLYSSPPNLTIEPGHVKKESFYGGGVSFQPTNQTVGGFSVHVSRYGSSDVLRWEARGSRRLPGEPQ